MFRIEWGNGFAILGTFAECELHPKYNESDVFERLPFGWQAI